MPASPSYITAKCYLHHTHYLTLHALPALHTLLALPPIPTPHYLNNWHDLPAFLLTSLTSPASLTLLALYYNVPTLHPLLALHLLPALHTLLTSPALPTLHTLSALHTQVLPIGFTY